MKKTIILLSILTSFVASAQSIEINPNAANSSAVLDLKSTTKGFLPPRMTGEQMRAISSPAQGLLAFCTDCGTTAIGEYYFYKGTAWVLLSSTTISSFTSVGAVSGTATPNGATVTSGGELKLAPANGSYPGVVTTEAQTIAGVKTFSNGIVGNVTGDVTGNVTGNAGTATKIASITNADIVQLTSTQTLTNKTLTSPNITGTGAIAGTFTGNLTGNVTGNVTGNAATVTTNANLTGDVTSIGNATTVVKINGTSLSGLATGILKNTMATGVPTIATAGTDYQAPITLTTSGTGAATLVSNTLNIPNVSYTLPTATSSTLGGVKPDGISILNEAGVLKVTPLSIGAQAAGSYLTSSTAVTSFNGSTTGLTPASATSGAVSLGGILVGANGGTGVDNTGKTITLGGNLTTSGAFTTALTTTANTAVTLPVSGTLATLAGIETLTNKTLTSPLLTGNPQAPTAPAGTITTQIATTEFVKANSVDLTTAQTIVGAKTFSTDLTVNGLTVGKGTAGIATNTAIGVRALEINTTGADNTAVGLSTLQSNTEGNYNTAIGKSALSLNNIGFFNTAIGRSALSSNTRGSFNTANGADALTGSTTGSANTAIGGYALFLNQTGSSNTAIGYSADVASGALSNATAIGNGAIVNTSNKIQLGNGEVTAVQLGTGAKVTLETGFVKITGGTPGAGKVLTSDAAGLASWATISSVVDLTTAQTIAGVKTFSSAPVLSTATASQALFTDANKNIVSKEVTGSGNVVMSNAPAFTGTVSGITKSMIDLENVDNTSDANKPVSTATSTALANKVDKVAGERLINAAEITKLGNQSGTNTGDQILPTLSSLGAVATNTAITGATNTKITYDSKGLVTGGAAATTSDIAETTDKKYVTDAQLTKINNTLGINTGDNAVNSLYSGLVTNATHTGDVTGATALTIANDAVTTAKIVAGAITDSKVTDVAASKITGTLPVSKGGTGATTLAANNVLLGNGTSALQAVAPGANGNVLTSNGTTWTSVAASAGAAAAGTLTGNTLASTVVGSSLTSVGTLTSATVSGKVIVGASSATATSAVLEANSTTQGFLPPRMTGAQRNLINNPVQGLMIYCTDCGADGEPEYYNGRFWANMSGVRAIGSLKIGDEYQGGKVAYILTNEDIGYDANTQHGIIAATTNSTIAEGIRWNNEIISFTNATGNGIGAGVNNTNTIIQSQGVTVRSYAAGLARSWNDGNYNDWYLPSKEELNKLYINRVAIGDNFGNYSYWSSTEIDSYYVWYQDFRSGDQRNTLYKGNTLAVRAIRYF